MGERGGVLEEMVEMGDWGRPWLSGERGIQSLAVFIYTQVKLGPIPVKQSVSHTVQAMSGATRSLGLTDAATRALSSICAKRGVLGRWGVQQVLSSIERPICGW